MSLLSALYALGLACLIGITVWPAWSSDMLTPFRPLILAPAAAPLCIALLRPDRRLVGMSVLILLASWLSALSGDLYYQRLRPRAAA